MTIENGRPADESGRLEKETAVYDLLEQLDIPFTRADHEPAFTMDACEEVAAALETKICKNLFLCNRQKTSFYLLLMPGDHQPAGMRTAVLRQGGGAGTATASDPRLCHHLWSDV